MIIGGTSASSPTLAAFVAVLNNVRLGSQPPLGFLNSFIYSKGFEDLNDITNGHNGGCGTPGFNVTIVATRVPLDTDQRLTEHIAGDEELGSRQVI